MSQIHLPRLLASTRSAWRGRRRAVVATVVAALAIGGLVPVIGAAPAAQAVAFDCTAGFVYSLERPSTGSVSYVARVNTATGATTRWPGSFPAQSTNGLALSGDGLTAYAVSQPLSGSTAALYSLTSEGVSKTVSTSLTVTGVLANNLIGGAINPVNGYFYFGGYDIENPGGGPDRAVFQLHAYDLVTNTYVGRVGRVRIPESTPDQATNSTGNGDIAFDAQGNLYLIWSFTGGVTNKLVRVDAVDVRTTAGGPAISATLLSSPTASANGLAYSGMTFDGDGTLFLENAAIGNPNVTQIAPTDPNTGQPTAAAKTVGIAGVGPDLASCSYPPTIRLLKNITGRFPTSDQFAYSIFRTDAATVPIASATSTGSSLGVQSPIAGPAIAVPGKVYRIQETGASGANLEFYYTTYSCVWGAETTPFASGTAYLANGVKSATLPPIPSNRSGQQLSCTLKNEPLAAAVTVSKVVQDAFGQNAAPGAGWTVRAAATATSNSVITTPSATTQVTPASGTAPWALLFSAATGRANVAVSETQQTDYQFVNATCSLTNVFGATTTIPLSSARGGTVAMRTADELDCSFTNKVKPSYLTLTKSVTSPFGGSAIPTAWTLTGAGPSTISGVTGAAAVTRVQVTAGAYALSEANGPAGYTATSLVCRTPGGPVAGPSLANPSVTVAPGADVTCTFSNAEQPSRLTLVKVVANAATGGLAVPGDWTLTATPKGIPGQTTVSGPGNSASVTNQQVFSGDYTLSESAGSPGYAPGTWLCSGGTVTGAVVTVPSGGNVTCTITNTAQAPKLTLVKTVTNDNGGTAVPTAWTLKAQSTTGPAAISGATGSAAVTSATVPAGSYSLGESGPDGYTASAWTCVGATLTGASVTVPLGGDVTCTINNNDIAPKLTLVKVVQNGTTGGTAVVTDWNLTATGPTSITGKSGSQAVTAASVNAGTYTLAESAGPAGYTAGPWSCTGGALTGSSVVLAVGGNAVCTIINTAQAPKLTLVKTVTNDNGGTALPTAWTLSATGPILISGATGSAAVTSATVPAGLYTLGEAAGPGGYAPGLWDCGPALVTGAVVTVPLGGDVTCTINNNDIAPKLTLVKLVDNGTTGGTAVATDWNLTATGPTSITGKSGSPAVTAASVNVGTYTLAESAGPLGYTAGPWSCTGGALTGSSVVLAVGGNAVCTITNTAQPATLTLVKTVTNDNGGTAVPTAWTLKATGPVSISGATGSAPVTAATVPAGSYTLGESGPDGYLAGAWTCVGATPTDASVTVPLGGSVTCTLNNNDIAPKLTLVKLVDNGTTGGTAVATDWDLTATGPTSITGKSGSPAVTAATVNAGSYALSEANGPLGYAPGTWSCAGATVSGASVTVPVGGDVTCTITNTAQPATLTLVKVVEPNDSGASATPSDWNLTAAGPTSITGPGGSLSVIGQQVAIGTYTLSEAGPGGWTGSDWVCDGATSQTASSVQITVGQAVTCTVTNTAVAPRLTLVKTVDNGETGATAAPADWQLSAVGPVSITGASGTPAVTAAVVQVGTYDLSEASALTGYTLTDLTCADAAGPVAGPSATNPSVDLALGQSVTCTFANTAIAPTLTLVKVVDNAAGGTAVPADWTLTGAGPVTITGASGDTTVTGAVVKVGPYDLSEAGGPAGYVYSNLLCTNAAGPIAGVSVTAPTVSLRAGDAITCTFTNTATASQWTLIKSSDPVSGSTVLPGAVITYSVTAQLVSGVAATGVIVTDDLSNVLDDATLVGGSIAAPPGTSATLTGTDLVWTVGTLATTVTLTYQVTVNADARGVTLRNVVTGVGSEPPAPCADAATACRTTEHFTPAWTLRKSANPATGSAVLPGDQITYTLTATNTGPVVLSGAAATDDLSAVLGNAALAEPLAGGLSLSGETLTWAIPDIPVGGSVDVSYTVTVNPATWGAELANVVTGTGPVPPADCAALAPGGRVGAAVAPERGAPPCSTDHFVPRWTLEKTSTPASGSTVAPGSVVTYTLTAVNVSRATITTATAVDDLTRVLSHAKIIEPLSGSLALNATTLVWTIPTLVPGATATVSYSVRIDADAAGVQIVNVVTPGDASGGCVQSCTTTQRTPPPPPPLPVTGGTVSWLTAAAGGFFLLLGGLVLMVARRRRL